MKLEENINNNYVKSISLCNLYVKKNDNIKQLTNISNNSKIKNNYAIQNLKNTIDKEINYKKEKDKDNENENVKKMINDI